jgi:hypothetical protein
MDGSLLKARADYDRSMELHPVYGGAVMSIEQQAVAGIDKTPPSPTRRP